MRGSSPGNRVNAQILGSQNGARERRELRALASVGHTPVTRPRDTLRTTIDTRWNDVIRGQTEGRPVIGALMGIEGPWDSSLNGGLDSGVGRRSPKLPVMFVAPQYLGNPRVSCFLLSLLGLLGCLFWVWLLMDLLGIGLLAVSWIGRLVGFVVYCNRVWAFVFGL
ncbi:hypothetical protein CXB51_009913 [Gossypium anomalum]|uniref:Uncharacterized protein n=1 Tax=Gossypium anomalum TaxID=47600 RepID=A0A8J6D1E1_9ROSI|nr:hypothetical protein CXB51_009913 [Gossypium anomalum]